VALCTVLLTQPALRTAPLALRLREQGFEVVCWPLSELAEAPGTDWGALAPRLAGCDWVLFPSPGAVAIVLAGFERVGLAWPGNAGIGLVGAGSAEALRGWEARIAGLEDARVLWAVGERQDAQALLSHAALESLRGRRVAVMRRSGAGEGWIASLRSRGADVFAPVVYRSRPLAPPAGAAGWLAARAAANQGFVMVVADVESGRRLGRFVARRRAVDWIRRQPVATQHPRIAESLSADGWRWVVRHPPGSDGLIGALESLRNHPP
jgi:uroporphyrinogen-III synthase